MYSIINALSVWMKERRKRPKESIRFHCHMCLPWIDHELRELSRMANLDRLILTNRIYLKGETDNPNQILFECDESKRVSVHLSCSRHFRERTDIWETFCRYKDLKELTFCTPNYDFLD